jgi:hypothetical protein
MKPRQIIIRLVLPIVWKFFPRRRPYYLQEFEMAELDSCWQVLHSIPFAPKEMRSKLFMHAVEELGHFQTFGELKEHYSYQYLNRPILKRKMLLPSSDKIELIKFLTYVYIGEREVNSDFYAYSQSLKSEPLLSSTYLRLKVEEDGHEEKTLRWLKNISQNANVNLGRIEITSAFKRSFDTYKKLMTMIGSIPMSLLLFVIYISTAPIALIDAKKRMAFSRKKELEIFKLQLNTLEKIN